MFCKNCGQKQTSDDSKFCHNCGKGLNHIDTITPSSRQTSNATTPRMTVEQYMARTNIKNVNEAENYLSKLKILFVTVFFGMFLTRYVADAYPDIYSLVFLLYLALLIYFVVYCVKILRLEKISRANAIFSILFAPLSWIWFYPEIANPLKIITGEKLPPEPSFFSEEQKKLRQKNNKRFWKKFTIFIVACIGIITLLSVWLYFYFQSNSLTNTINVNQPAPSNISNTYPGYLIKYNINTFDENTEAIQSQLNLLGYNLVVDGYFGSNTRSAIIDFQKKNGLKPDGIVGQNTWNALFGK